jgi:hypothetical protein
LSKSKKPSAELLTDELAKLIISQCTADAIQQLLRSARDEGKEVYISAKNKEELVEENLRRAVASSAIPIGAVYELLADAEEHMPHHAFFFSPVDKVLAQAFNDFETVGTRLFGGDWKGKGFPNYLSQPKGEVWSDFRQVSNNGVEAGWVAKMYRGDSRWVIDPDQSSESANRRVRVWVRRYMRDVWLVKWHRHFQILEIRVPFLESRAELQEAKAGLFKAIRKLVTLDELDDYDLRVAATTIAHDDTCLNGLIRCPHSRLLDSHGGSTIIATRHTSEDVHSAPERLSAIKHYGRCEELVVFWQKTKAVPAVREELKTVIGVRGWNNILFPASSTRLAVDYVTNRILELQGE